MDNEEIVSKQRRVQGAMKGAYVDGEIVVGVTDGCIALGNAVGTMLDIGNNK
jgi:hypothetical protein